MVAVREIKERVRGRIFRVGTLIMLLAVAAADHHPDTSQRQQRAYHPDGRRRRRTVARGRADRSTRPAPRTRTPSSSCLSPPSAAAKADLRSGKVDFAIVDGEQILLNQPATSSSSPADPALVQDVAEYLGVLRAYRTAGLTPAQATQVNQPSRFRCTTLQPGTRRARRRRRRSSGWCSCSSCSRSTTPGSSSASCRRSRAGSSRCCWRRCARSSCSGARCSASGWWPSARPRSSWGSPSSSAAAVGSDLLHGTAPLVLACELLWLVLGYAFYCWVYAAAGSMAERQDQVQTLALPLSIPILLGYIFSITVASSGNAEPLLQGPRLPAPDGPVLHARAGGAEPGHLVGVRGLGADHHRRHGRAWRSSPRASTAGPCSAPAAGSLFATYWPEAALDRAGGRANSGPPGLLHLPAAKCLLRFPTTRADSTVEESHLTVDRAKISSGRAARSLRRP